MRALPPLVQFWHVVATARRTSTAKDASFAIAVSEDLDKYLSVFQIFSSCSTLCVFAQRCAAELEIGAHCRERCTYAEVKKRYRFVGRQSDSEKE